ncbi:helix-turn-helix domain-containing protein [Leeia sp. TBRC 13508]|uniref:Helix-turn-helix domain-containing protein n=1 Tax=Leeia speluncae TaxID=2884804 RepID=A0ABS8D2Y5_9NEIS|nr:S24 family peptidase [Leeia speluncae]MCB6182351.1 helix-turn-helix domain-containing protein [Leeia speluncae]
MKNKLNESFSTKVIEPENERLLLGGRLRDARERLSLSRSECADQIGVSISTLQAWEIGEREPDATKIARLARLYKVSTDELLLGEVLASKQIQHRHDQSYCVLDTTGNKVDLSEFVFIPRFDLQASAGHGALTSDNEKPVFTMAFRKYWIDNYLRADPKNLSVISVHGDSMEGVLNDRDVILLNHADTNAVGGLYVLRVDGNLIVKRVQRIPGGKLRVVSANEAYEPFEVDINNPPDDFAVIGKVVWFGRML